MSAPGADTDRIERLFASAPDLCAVVERGAIAYANPAWLSLLGYDPESLRGRSVFEILHADDHASFRNLAAFLDGERLHPHDLRVANASGDCATFRWQGHYDPTNDALYVIGRPIDEDARGENIIGPISHLHGADFLDAICRALAAALHFDVAIVGRTVENDSERVDIIAGCNGIENLAGLSYLLKGTPCQNVVGQNFCRYLSGVAEAFPDDQLLIDWRIEAYYGLPIFSAEGAPVGLIVLLGREPRPNRSFEERMLRLFSGRINVEIQKMDMSRELERQRARTLNAVRLSELGEMAAGIAHEINNPLAVIQGHAVTLAQMAEEKSLDLASVGRSANKIVDTVRRISGIVRSLRALAKDGSQDPFEMVSVRKVITDIASLSEARFRAASVDLRILFDDGSDGAIIECRPVQVAQVLLNLLNNSLDAVGGRPGAWTELRARTGKDGLVLSVMDSGRGIPADIVDRILQPFFTTKPGVKGVGLGLSTAVKIVEIHGES